MAIVWERYYILALQLSVQKCIRGCVLCIRMTAKTVVPSSVERFKRDLAHDTRIVSPHNPTRANHIRGVFEVAVGNLKRYVGQMPSISNFTYSFYYIAISSRIRSWIVGHYMYSWLDWQVLTPTHFIVQRSLWSPPWAKIGWLQTKAVTETFLDEVRERLLGLSSKAI